MADRLGSGPWLKVFSPNPRARLRLLCLPFAGGGSLFYRTWPAELPPDIEVCAVQLPGREARLREEPFRQLGPLVEAIQESLSAHLATPFALFGHSMGALLGFELGRRLGARLPAHLFLSGRLAPHLPDPDPPIHHLPKQEFMEELRRLNGTPREVLEHPELMELMLPTLRADFELCETYTYRSGPPLDCPLSIYGGAEDPKTALEGLEAWRQHTRAAFRLRLFPGDHFYLQTARLMLMQALSRDIQQVVDGLR